MHRGWFYRKKINIKLISDISAATRKIGLTDRKVVKVTAENHTYDFFLCVFDKSNDEHNKYVNIIRGIILSQPNEIS